MTRTRHPCPLRLQLLLRTDQQSSTQERSALHRAILASGNLPSYPFIVRRGWVVCELITSQERLSSLKDEFENTGLPYEVVSVTPSLEPIDLLTDQQRRFVVEAIERGYCESPRRCSLTDLADVLGVSKSTARLLHREGRLKQFIGETGYRLRAERLVKGPQHRAPGGVVSLGCSL